MSADVDKSRRTSYDRDHPSGGNESENEELDDEDGAGGRISKGGGGKPDAFAYDNHTAAWLMDMVRPEKDVKHKTGVPNSPVGPVPWAGHPSSSTTCRSFAHLHIMCVYHFIAGSGHQIHIIKKTFG